MAIKLAALPPTQTDEDLEKELLSDPTETDNTATQPSATIAGPSGSTTNATDTVGDRVNQIFGKRAAPEKSDHDQSSPKKVPEAPPSVPATPAVPAASPSPPAPQAGSAEEDAAAVPLWEPGEIRDDDNDDDDEDEDDGGDQPQNFPDLGFPSAPPRYPEQPEFFYQYRVPGSTPRSRRLDFERSIVLRPCERDRHTGRVRDDDYQQREDAEMKVSLGYVSINSKIRLVFKIMLIQR